MTAFTVEFACDASTHCRREREREGGGGGRALIFLIVAHRIFLVVFF